MTGLLNAKGKPMPPSASFKKATPPPTGEKFGNWAGEQFNILKLPGGGLLNFDLDQLTLADYRQMLDHYQVNSSQSILTFMMHQVEWHVECPDKKIEDQCNQQLADLWSKFVFAMSQSFWSGYSPNVLQWENDVDGKRIALTKIKDLLPEDSRVHWKKIDTGQGQPKISVFDGIKQEGWANPIPTTNSFWYPLLMQNGNYYGKKLLRSAFQPYFFSMLMHLFSNRYYERFGEPVPVGRAPFDETIQMPGDEKEIRGDQAMGIIINSLRNRSTVVLPSSKTPMGDESNPGYDYTLEYLESQMRGADFGQYMTRLDEEISLALFTPILMMRTADVGSYNLGTQHTQLYLWILNAICRDWAYYIDWYILRPIAIYNSPKGERFPVGDLPKIKFRRLGKTNGEIVRDAVIKLLDKDSISLDLAQLGEEAGLSLKEKRALRITPEESDDDNPDDAPDGGTGGGGGEGDVVGTTQKLTRRVQSQVERAYRTGNFDLSCDLGFQREMRRHMGTRQAERFYARVEYWLRDNSADSIENMSYSSAAEFMDAFTDMAEDTAKELAA